MLAIAPTPADAARLTTARIAAALRRAGRQRGVEDLAAKLHRALRAPQLRQPPLVEQAMSVQALALLAALNAACAGTDQLAKATGDAFAQHPDHAIITSFPGLADTGGARILAEIGDDRTRFTDPRTLKAYACSAPVTRASGRSIVITRRRIKNDRLAAAGWTSAFASLDPLTRRTSPLRPPPRGRRPARGGATPPVKPLPRPTPPLPNHRPALHRGGSLPRARA